LNAGFGIKGYFFYKGSASLDIFMPGEVANILAQLRRRVNSIISKEILQEWDIASGNFRLLGEAVI
jgi:hypothetical protein